MLTTKRYVMSSVSVDSVSFPSIRSIFPDLLSDDGIRDLQQFRATRQLGGILGYVLVYHNKDIPKTILHPNLKELSAWKEEAWKQDSTYFEEYPNNVKHYAMWPYKTLEMNIAAEGDQGQLHIYISRTNYNFEKTTAQQEYCYEEDRSADPDDPRRCVRK